MSYNRPIEIFTEIKNAPVTKRKSERTFYPTFTEVVQTDPSIEMNVEMKDRHINVTGIGEMILEPDRFSIVIKCRSIKDTIQDAKNSVTRRMDYIQQTLKNHALKEEDYKVYQHTFHADSMVHIDCEVEAHFTDFGKCQGVSNLLVEKLGSAITVSLPCCYHAKGSVDKVRKQTGMLAIHNARQKASEMAKMIHLSVGNAVKIEEIGTTETYGGVDKDEDIDMNPSIQQRIKDSTLSVSSKFNVYFELKSAKSKKK